MKPGDIIRIIEELKEGLTRERNNRPVPETKYKFSRNWYIVEFDTADYYAVREWCKEQFGPEDQFPNAWSRWQHRYEDRIFIRDEQDYFLFIMRWGKG